MTSQVRLQALSIDLVALEAVVRALARSQARRSPTALGDLLQALSEEADRMGETVALFGDSARGEAGCAQAVIEAWMQELKEEAVAA